MNTLFFECGMGAAGDMITAALLSLYDDPHNKVEKLNSFGIPGIRYDLKEKSINGIVGYNLSVSVHGVEESETTIAFHEHRHNKLTDIESIIGSLNIPQNVKDHSIAIYNKIALAESQVHGKSVGEIHFHEVGNMDAIADVVAASFLINDINPEKIICSPICTGFGSVTCAHGMMPVPAPATSILLENVPVYAGDIEGELCTPTGAAILSYYTESFQQLPAIRITKTGYGFGNKEFKKLNCIRAIIGETENEITELEFNVDDMTPEAIAYALDIFRNNGALDACWEPIGMKKNRPGFLVHIICSNDQRDKFVSLIFKHTSTIGIRESICSRYILKRNSKIITTKWGQVHLKVSEGYGIKKAKPEFEDLSRIAVQNDLSLDEIEKEIRYNNI